VGVFDDINIATFNVSEDEVVSLYCYAQCQQQTLVNTGVSIDDCMYTKFIVAFAKILHTMG
jgi:hypothetical protein